MIVSRYWPFVLKNYAFAAIPVRLLDGSDRQTVYHQWVGETSDHAIA
jgi:hypothetical protein